MKQTLIALMEILLAAADARADERVRSQAAARIHKTEAYSANQGGWN
jgi:hypothetical protein